VCVLLCLYVCVYVCLFVCVCVCVCVFVCVYIYSGWGAGIEGGGWRRMNFQRVKVEDCLGLGFSSLWRRRSGL